MKNLKDLKVFNYSGTGNITPVINIDSLLTTSAHSISATRHYLENNHDFRIWLREKGSENKADSIIIYYYKKTSTYDFVMFVAEPNAPLTSHFSEMCGNGIRALGFHLFNVYSKNEFKVSAGSVKKIEVLESNKDWANVSVTLGAFKNTKQSLAKYLNLPFFKKIKDLSAVDLADILNLSFFKGYNFGVGLNSDTNSGEPHLILLLNDNEYKKMYSDFFKTVSPPDFQHDKLRQIVSFFGSRITFNKDIFPEGINFSIAIINNNKIFISTHERNLNLFHICRHANKKKGGICSCNTLACGTAGAVAASLAKKTLKITSEEIITCHPGGTISYVFDKNNVIMIGTVEKFSN